jgi:hypothetical protein
MAREDAHPVPDDEVAIAPAPEPPTESKPPTQPEPDSSLAGFAGMTRSEMETAAMSGRQVAGPLAKGVALDLLRTGEMVVVGRLLSASNATFFCLVADSAQEGGRPVVASCVYKPIRGERPLYDFPDETLACREVAAFAVSEASGWEVIPPTVMRDGPFGPGMVQLWVEVDESVGLDELLSADNTALRRMAVLDVVLNNADRKAGHLLPLPDGRIMGCDNGLCFSTDPKLRTVLWRWRGQPLQEDERAALRDLRRKLDGSLGDELRLLLDKAEVSVTAERIDALLSAGRLPLPNPNRPAVPWPPY